MTAFGSSWLFAALLLAAALWVGLPLAWWVRLRSVPVLRPVDRGGVPPPALAVVVAARDEAGTEGDAAALERAARSWLALDHPALEVVVVDDRSSDATTAVLERAFGGDPRARVLRGAEPPADWIGKVHAQATGVAATAAPWVLLTDADVRLHPAAARAALAWAERERLDHVALMPRFEARGAALRAFVAAFALLFTVLVRPWEARDPRSPRTLGIGAFGLYRRSALERAGGLAAVRARPDDDLALARALKAAGGRSAVAFAPDLVALAWYPTLGAALAGLEKNAFVGVGFRPAVAVLAAVALLATHVAPFAALGAPEPWARAVALAIVACVLAAYAAHGRRAGHPAWLGALHPLSTVALVVALLRSTVRVLRRGAVAWRGRTYPLRELRAAQRTAAARERAAARARRARAVR
jgi:hypothetical protein